MVKITIFFTNKSAVLSKNKNNLQEKHLILTEFTVFLFNGYIMIRKEEQRDGGRLFLLFVTLTIVCCKWVETQGGNL